MGKRKHILVVDDEEHNRDLLDAVLTTFGYDCVFAKNGYQALETLEPRIDLVLLDVMMPGIDGFEVARRIRSRKDCGDIPIIMVTALASKQDRLSAVEVGANDFITKPIDNVELRIRMESLLKMKEAQDAIKQHRAELEATVLQRTAALRESEERMRLLIEVSPIGIMMVQQRRYWYVNPSLVRMFGYAGAADIVGKPVEALCVPHDRVKFEQSVDSVLTGDKVVHGLEIEGLKSDGHSVELAVWLTSTEFSEQPALLGFLIDISEQKALRSQLLHAQKMEALGTLAGGIAHDFNNILFVMMGFAELAMESVSKDSRPFHDLERVMQAAERARYMVQQILTFSRQTEQEKKPIQISPIVKEAVKFLRASIPATIEIRETIGSDLGMILADPTQIHQVLMNLCTNAAHAMRKNGGVLEITMDGLEIGSNSPTGHLELNPGKYLRLTVSDSGHGMPTEVIDRIFEPYFTTKKPGEGTGLGLAVVHGIVKSHGGDIGAWSKPGQGSTFSAYFPIAASGSQPQPQAPESIPKGSERLLIVDDEDDLAQMNKRSLEKLGYQVVAVSQSEEALNLFQTNPEEYDLIITDLTMPHMTGLELAHKIRAIRTTVPIILCTGFSELLTQEQVTAAGIQALLTKPVSRGKMAVTIRHALEGVGKREF
jgi:PAS domain S-box-containing protein